MVMASHLNLSHTSAASATAVDIQAIIQQDVTSTGTSVLSCAPSAGKAAIPSVGLAVEICRGCFNININRTMTKNCPLPQKIPNYMRLVPYPPLYIAVMIIATRVWDNHWLL